MTISLNSATEQSSIEQLVQQYMAIERQPIVRLEGKKSLLNIQKGVFSDTKSKLQALYDAADDLADTSDNSIFNAVQVSSSDTTSLTVTAGDDAAVGQYDIRIRQMATATTMKSTGYLNTHASVMSSIQVVDGYSTIDTSESWADAGFDTTPDGTVTINGTAFTLADYSTVDDFFDAVNDSAANANIYYDSDRDKIILESTDTSSLIISETGTNGLLTEANITADTYSTNQTGLDASDYLYKINFDTALSESDSGSFKINGATIEWDADADSLNDIISRINSSDAGVTAFYDDTLDKIVFTASATGSEEIQWEDVSGTFLTDTLKFSGVTQTSGNDAKFTINSTSASDEITKSSNNFTINGIKFTLKAVTVANDSYTDGDTEAVTVKAEKDDTQVRNKINTMLSKYNDFIDYIKLKTDVDTTSYSRGPLAGESVFLSLKNSILSIFLGQVSGVDTDKPSYLSEIGITLGDDLHASISDSSAFTDWINDDPASVENLFNSTNGVAARLKSLIEPFTETYGIIDDRSDSLDDRIDQIDKRIASLDERLAGRENYYRTQFSSLQSMLIMANNQLNLVNSLTNSINSLLG
ncbi:flagellar filament capping protein FliD [bacterium]|nr:flagellar filament capping protein FliD [bacterium]